MEICCSVFLPLVPVHGSSTFSIKRVKQSLWQVCACVCVLQGLFVNASQLIEHDQQDTRNLFPLQMLASISDLGSIEIEQNS